MDFRKFCVKGITYGQARNSRALVSESEKTQSQIPQWTQRKATIEIKKS